MFQVSDAQRAGFRRFQEVSGFKLQEVSDAPKGAGFRIQGSGFRFQELETTLKLETLCNLKHFVT